MTSARTLANEAQKNTKPVRVAELGAAPLRDRALVQIVAPRAVYRRAESNCNGPPAIDLLALQRTMGNRQVQRMVTQRMVNANDPQLSAFAEEKSGIKLQTRLAAGAPNYVYIRETSCVEGQIMHAPKPGLESNVQRNTAVSNPQAAAQSSASGSDLWSQEFLKGLDKVKPEETKKHLRESTEIPDELMRLIEPLNISPEERRKGIDAVVFRSTSPSPEGVTETVRLQLNGLLCYEISREEHEQERTGGNIAVPKVVTKTFYTKNQVIPLAPLEEKLTANPLKQREAIEKRLRMEKQALIDKENRERTLKELGGYQEKVLPGEEKSLTVKQIWDLSDPKDFAQSLNGVTKKLLPAFQSLLDALDKADFDSELDAKHKELEEKLADNEILLVEAQNSRDEKRKVQHTRQKKQISAQIKDINFYFNNYLEVKHAIKHAVNDLKLLEETQRDIRKIMENRKGLALGDPEWQKRKRIWEQEANAKDKLAITAARELCNVIAYYLYGRATGKIKETDFARYYVEQVKRGNITIQNSEPFSIGSISYASGSGNWRKEMGMEAAIGDDKHPIPQAELTVLNSSGVRIALSHQLRPPLNHWLLIVKDIGGKWHNMDHHDENFEWRGGETNWNKVVLVRFDTDAQAQAKQKLEDLRRTATTQSLQSLLERIIPFKWIGAEGAKSEKKP